MTAMKPWRAILIAALLWTGFALAYGQSPLDEIVPPKPIYKVDPVHPPALFEAAIEGTATILATIDPRGSVRSPTVESATHEEFGIAAMLASSEWIFEPATRHGVPVELQVRIPFDFAIAFEHKLNVELGRGLFKELNVPIIPSSELEQAPLPSFVPAFSDYYPPALEGSDITASISVEFVISPTGAIHNPRILNSSAKGFDEAAIRAVAEMRYKPIYLDGQPVYVSVMRPIQMSE